MSLTELADDSHGSGGFTGTRGPKTTNVFNKILIPQTELGVHGVLSIVAETNGVFSNHSRSAWDRMEGYLVIKIIIVAKILDL